MPRNEHDPEDPNELVGVALQGTEADEEHMATCVVDEFLRMGLGTQQVLEMFRNPFYRMTHGVYLRRGEPWVQELIDRVVQNWRMHTCRT